jgi:shikimate kinase
MKKPIFLIGYMGAGKSTLGKKLAKRLEMNFIDLDSYIEQRFFKTISQLFEEKGESGFREIEKSALAEVAEFENAIIATGGGTPCFFDNIELMNKKGLTVYLHWLPEKLLQNLTKGKTKRPLIKDKTDKELLRFIKENLLKREPFYCQAKLTINPEEDIEKIISNFKL